MINKPKSASVFIIDLLALYVWFLVVFLQQSGLTSISIRAVVLMVFVALLWFIIAVNSSIVSINVNLSVFSALKEIFIGYSILSVGVVGVVAVFGKFAPNNKLLLWPLFLGLIFSSLLRFFVLVIGKHLLKEGYHQKQILLIGGGRIVEKVMNQIFVKGELGYKLYGILADSYHESLPKGCYLGKIERFSEIVRTGLIDEVIIALPLRFEELIVELVAKCELEGVRVRIVPDFYRIIRNRAVLEKIGDIPLIGIRTEPLSLLKNRILKKGFDIIFSIIVLIVLSPLFAIIAFFIKLTSKGPVFFLQERICINGRPFQMAKFRSMTAQEPDSSNTQHTAADDPRVTSVGKLLRKYSLDELPQFWNVLIGEMSVVGPRPELTHFVNKFGCEIDKYKVRHFVKPGITGLAQVNGWRGNTSKKKRIECDIEYIENWAFWMDLKIIFLTLFGRKEERGEMTDDGGERIEEIGKWMEEREESMAEIGSPRREKIEKGK